MYKLPDLGYDYGALGKYISADIMSLHHTKHHQAYVDKLNTALGAVDDEIKNKSIEELLVGIDALPESVQTAIRNNGGGHYNHTLFWRWMSPNGGEEPKGIINEQIVQKYGSFQEFVDEFTTKALGVFGSGWVWLQPDLDIITTPNQDTPLMKGLPEPILGLDVWEHAYYLDYKNRRDDYVKAWWNVVDWDFVAERHKELQA